MQNEFMDHEKCSKNQCNIMPFTGFLTGHSSRFPLRLYYSKSIEKLYESYRISSVGCEALSRAEPPAGPPKITNSFGESTFPKIWCMHPNLGAIVRNENPLSWTSRMDHQARLNLKYFFSRATMQNEFMDHENSSKNHSRVIPLTCFLDIPF